MRMPEWWAGKEGPRAFRRAEIWQTDADVQTIWWWSDFTRSSAENYNNKKIQLHGARVPSLSSPFLFLSSSHFPSTRSHHLCLMSLRGCTFLSDLPTWTLDSFTAVDSLHALRKAQVHAPSFAFLSSWGGQRRSFWDTCRLAAAGCTCPHLSALTRACCWPADAEVGIQLGHL